jgi:peroxiredoxin
MALQPGSKAPLFTLKTKSANGLEDFRLEDHIGKSNVVLIFVPLAFTGVCTNELCSLSSGIAAYETLNAKVVAISVDSPFAQEIWAKKENITIPLISDLNKEVTTAYDILFKGLAGIGDTSARAVFVIDRNGIIQHSQVTPTPGDLPDFDAVKASLSTLA